MNWLSKLSFIALISLLIACGGEDKPAQTTLPITQAPPPVNQQIGQLDEMINQQPDNPDLYAKRALAYYENEGYDEAIQDLQRALTYDSTNVEYLHLLADTYMDYYKSRDAIETMQKAEKLYPDRIPTLLKLSEFYFITQQHREAARTVEKVMEKDGQNAEGYFMMGRILEETGDKDRAISAYQSAVENDPDLTEVWLKLGTLFAEKDKSIALRYFQSAIDTDETNPLTHFAKATYLHNKGLLEEALLTYEDIHRISPQFADAYYNAGLAYMEMDSVEKAYTQFDMTIKMQPVHYMGFYYRGLSSEILQNPQAARRDYKQALNLKPDFDRAQEALAKLPE